MTERAPRIFDSRLWSAEELQLNAYQISYLPQLQKLLEGSQLPVVSTLRSCAADPWTLSEMRQLEKEMLKNVGRGKGKPLDSAIGNGLNRKEQLQERKRLSQARKEKELGAAFDILGKVVARHQMLTEAEVQSPFPRSLHKLQLEQNPFNDDPSCFEMFVGIISKLVSDKAKELALSSQGPEADRDQFRRFVALGVLSSIIQCQLLDKAMLVALIEALANQEKSLLWINQGCYAWSLSLAWQGEADAERRMFIPDQLTGVLLSSMSEAEIRRMFAKGLDPKQNLRKRHAAIYSELDKGCREILWPVFETAGLKQVLWMAGMAAYLRMPSAIAAARCRKTHTHAPRNEVMLRISKEAKEETNFSAPPVRNLSPSDMEDVDKIADKEIADTKQVEPIWMVAMRQAFNQQGDNKVKAALLGIAGGTERTGARLANFALYLSGTRKVSTVKRYSLLIARRVGCRLGEIDPLDLSIEKLEDYYRDALNDDWDDEISGKDQDEENSAAQTFHRNKRVTITAIDLFHKYLKWKGAPPLDELASLLKCRGLLPVDANFITIDEYYDVYKYFSGPLGPDGEYLISLLQVTVILAFRCGLRRSEVLGLLVEDLDSADHLHVRNNVYRDVKTSNSERTIPAGILLTPDELREVRSLLDKRSSASRSGKQALLFSVENDASVMFNANALVGHIHDALRVGLKDRSLKMHHFRHSFATLVTAKLLLKTTPFTRELLRHHPKTLEWLDKREEFRKGLFGNSTVRGMDLQAVAHLLGHGSAEVSVESYIHSLDWF